MAENYRLLLALTTAGALAAATLLSPAAPPLAAKPTVEAGAGQAVSPPAVAAVGAAAQPAGWDSAGSTGTVANPASGRLELVYPEPGKIALVIGDSQADGAAGVPGSMAWPRLAAEAAGYVPLFRGRGGTGFTAARPDAANYVTALRTQQWLVPHGGVGLVVIQGGGNDARVGAGDAEIADGAIELVRELRRSYPTAPMVMVGTLARAADDGGGRRHEVDAVLARAAAAAGVSFVPAGDWITRLGLGPHLVDGTHLDAAGHRLAADALLAELGGRGLLRDTAILAGGGQTPAG